MRVRRPYAFRDQHLTGIDLARQVERHEDLRQLREALAPRLGRDAAQELAEKALSQALDDVGEELVAEISRDIDAILRTWSRQADHYRTAGDRAEMGRVALTLGDLPGRLETRVHMIPGAGAMIADAIPAGLVSRLRYPVAAGRVTPEALHGLGRRLKDALPAAIARELVRVEALDALVHRAVQPLLAGMGDVAAPDAAGAGPGDLGARLAAAEAADRPVEATDWSGEGPTAEGWTSGDEETLREALSDGPLRLLRTWAPEPPPTPDHLPQGVESLAISADGRRAVWGRWEPWMHAIDSDDAVGDRRLGGIDGRSWWRHCLAAAVSPDGRRAATGGASITVWELPAGRVLLDLAEVETEALHALAFSPDGRLLATAGATRSVRVFDAATGELRWEEPLDDPAQAVAFTPDGRFVLAGGWAGVLSVHEADSGRRRASFDDIGGCINAVAVDPSGDRVATGGGGGIGSGAPLNPGEVGLRLWDAHSGAVLGDLPGLDWPVGRVAFAGDWLVALSDDGCLRAWAPGQRRGPPAATVDIGGLGDVPLGLAASPAGVVLVGTEAGWVAAWQLGR